MSTKKNIVLIGFMGSGKTTTGIKLSYKYRMPVEDTDKLIERAEGRTIREIFAEEGEEYFRQAETGLLESLLSRKDGKIYSVGGGTPVKPENRALLRQLGTVVFLRVKPETVYDRVKNDTSRPLLQCADPLSRIRELMGQRESAYEDCADVIVDMDEAGADAIIQALDRSPKFGRWKDKDRRDEKKMKLLVINGPNINFLGIREKAVYGNQDYEYLCRMIRDKANEMGIEIEIFQSNHEGAIIDRIQESYFDGTAGIVINPGAYTHYSYAIRDALASIVVPKCEIHISDITKREEFRKTSVTAPVCDKQIYGQGLPGYLMAIDFVAEEIKKRAENRASE